MNPITLIFGLTVTGIILYLINTDAALDKKLKAVHPKLKVAINLIAGLIVFMWLLQAFGLR